MEGLSIASIIISVLSIIIAYYTLIHQIEISYPNIELTIAPYKFSKQESFLLKYSKKEKRFYLILKANADNFSPTQGSIHSCFLKYSFFKKIDALTFSETERLPEEIKTYLNAFISDNVQLFNRQVVVPGFQEKTVVFVFKVPVDFVLCKSCKLESTFFGSKRNVIELEFDYNYENFDKFWELEECLYLAYQDEYKYKKPSKLLNYKIHKEVDFNKFEKDGK